MTITLPIAPKRRGACPTLEAPMQTGDGLLARLRLAGPGLTPAMLRQLAEAAAAFGNGTVEITARGNLQMRGLIPEAVSPFARAIRDLVAIETGLVVEVPPLSGEDPLEFADPRPLARAIKALSAPYQSRLGPKVSVIVDGNGQIGLSRLKADLRLVAVAPDRWLVLVAETLMGTTRRPEDCAAIVLAALAALGRDARASDLTFMDRALAGLVAPSAPVMQPTSQPVGNFLLAQGNARGLALPFGAIGWQALAQLADQGQQRGIGQFRLGPHHALIALGAPEALAETAVELGFIASPYDPRLRISACIGSAGCASGQSAARVDAAGLAAHMPRDIRLHVSGCAKGCAHPGPADITLVGSRDGYGLVINGRASDTPVARLRADQIAAALAGGRG
ncbi:precorrin-3B synthase [Devosia sp.]|uniref:precorrin-3B synthase n=1 Tax=Devosia sp. TaxID=1871048 RepID=UPI002AFE0BA6|nr:precorrin-3B synthase [Devosia sp.]